MKKLRFWLAYLRGRTPWDTKVIPPELIDTIEGVEALAPGRALDLGCGTGTNVIYLAERGWDAVGVDFVEKPVRRARKKAEISGIDARFVVGDVTRLHTINGIGGRFDLALDIGCLHSLSSLERASYAAGLIDLLRPGAIYVLYAWCPSETVNRSGGVHRSEIESLFGPGLQLERFKQGTERGRPSAWYWLKSTPEN